MTILTIFLTAAISIILTILACSFIFAGKLSIEKIVAYDRGWNDGFKEGVDSLLGGDDARRDYQDEEVGGLQW